jgi:hypothetical protein
MLKKTVFKGAQVGAIFGFSSAILYVFIIFIIVLIKEGISSLYIELLLPLIVIMPIVLSLLLATTTGLVFGFLLSKFHVSKKLCLAIHVFLCSLIAIRIDYLALSTLVSIEKSVIQTYGQETYYSLQIRPSLQLVFLLVFSIPSIVFIVLSFLTSMYMFKVFEIIKLEHEISNENANPTPA